MATSPYPKDVAGPPTNWDLLDEYLQMMSLKTLKASSAFYWDRWTWDTGTDEDKRLAEALDGEIKEREERMNRPGNRYLPAQQQQDSGRVTLDLIRQQQEGGG